MIEFLVNTFQITESEAELFAVAFKKKVFSKGERFVQFEKVCHEIGFVEEGLLKCVLIRENKEVIDDFVFTGQFVTNYFSFLTQKASAKDIVCLQDSIIRVISRSQLEELGSKHKFVEQIARIVSERLFLATHQKLEDLRLLTAEERYMKLLTSNSKLLQEIPQYEIASYLNVSPETVSRIRKLLTERS